MATDTASANTAHTVGGRGGGRGGHARGSTRRPYVEMPIASSSSADAFTGLVESISRGNEAQFELLKRDIDDLKAKIATLEADDNNNGIETLKEQLNTKYELLHRYMNSMGQRIADDMNSLSSRVQALESNKRIRELETNLGELAAKHADLEAKFESLESAFKALAKIMAFNKQ